MSSASPRVYCKPIYFTAPKVEGIDTVVAYSPSVIPGALRTSNPALSIVFDRNYLLMDPATFHAYNGLYNGCQIAVVVPADTNEDFVPYGSNIYNWAKTFTDIDEAVNWLISEAEKTNDPDFYVLMQPDVTRLFDMYAYDSIWYEITPTADVEIDESFIGNTTFETVAERWVPTCKVSVPPGLQATLHITYYTAEAAVPLKDRVNSICQY